MLSETIKEKRYLKFCKDLSDDDCLTSEATALPEWDEWGRFVLN